MALLAAIAAAAIAPCVMFGNKPSLHMLVALAAVILLSLVFAFFHLRHASLAAAVALAPVLGMIGAMFLGATTAPLILAGLTGFTIALFLADEIALRVAEGAGVADAVTETLRENALAAVGGAISAAAFSALLFFATHRARIPLTAALAELGTGLGALILLPLVASLLPFGEDFVTRANRLRELRARRIEKIVAVTEPRWGWSLTGVGIVCFALAFFGSRTLHMAAPAAHSALEIWVVAAVVVSGAFLSVTRDWRRSLAALIALALSALIGCWGYARGGIALTPASWLALMQVLGIGAVLILLVAQGAHPDLGEDATEASVRSLLGKTGAAVTASLLAVVVLLALLPSIGREAIALAAVQVFAGLGAVLLQPALAIAIETLAPRRSTIEARYRVN